MEKTKTALRTLKENQNSLRFSTTLKFPECVATLNFLSFTLVAKTLKSSNLVIPLKIFNAANTCMESNSKEKYAKKKVLTVRIDFLLEFSFIV